MKTMIVAVPHLTESK